MIINKETKRMHKQTPKTYHFKVKGIANKIVDMVFTDIGIITYFDVEVDHRIDKSKHRISVTHTFDENPTKPQNCKKTAHSGKFFYTTNKNAVNKLEESTNERANPPTIDFPVSKTIALIFQCLNSCFGKNIKMVLNFKLWKLEGEEVLNEYQLKIKVINNPATKESEEFEKLQSNSTPDNNSKAKKRKADQPEEDESYFNARFPPKLTQEFLKILQEEIGTDHPKYNKIKTRLETYGSQQQTPVAQNLSNDQVSIATLHIPAFIKDPLKNTIDVFYNSMENIAPADKLPTLQKLHEQNIRAIEMSTHQPVQESVHSEANSECNLQIQSSCNSSSSYSSNMSTYKNSDTSQPDREQPFAQSSFGADSERYHQIQPIQNCEENLNKLLSGPLLSDNAMYTSGCNDNDANNSLNSESSVAQAPYNIPNLQNPTDTVDYMQEVSDFTAEPDG